jgi:hypothetical protein
MAEEKVTDGAVQNQTEQTFTKSQVDKMLQTEADRRVQEALTTAKTGWEKEWTKKLEKAKTEAEQMAKLSAEEKELAITKAKAEELAQKERELSIRELQLKAIDVLAEKKLPVTFAKMLLGETAEDTLERIKAFETEFRKSVQAEVDLKLKGTTPNSSQKGEAFDMNTFIRQSARGRK